MNSLDSQLDNFATGETVDTDTGEVLPILEPQQRKQPLPMPAELAKAIIQVMGKAKAIAKDDDNAFGKYKYVSVDAFYAAIRPLMAEAGVLLVTDEVEVTTIQRPQSAWLNIVYDLTLYHQSGAGYGPIRRTILVQASGPQAFGAAMSYVEKYYLRSLFRVPTGEQDADAERQDDLPAVKPPRHKGPFSTGDGEDDRSRSANSVPTRSRTKPTLVENPLEKIAKKEAEKGIESLQNWWSKELSQEQRDALKKPDENGKPTAGWLVKLANEADARKEPA